jgi:hypothetical protein
MNTVDILREQFEKINQANENEGIIPILQAKWRVYESLHCVKISRTIKDFCASCQDEWEEVA